MTRIVATRVRPYRLPFTRPWRMAGVEIDRRFGWLVEIETSGGIRGFGDYAPLPLSAQGQATDGGLAERANALLGADVAEALDGLAADTPASALECALLDALARQRGVPLRRLLAERAADRVEVNAVAELAGVGDAVAAGFRVVKLKVGRGKPEAEAAALRALPIPDGVRLRLDANCAWPWDDAVRFIDAVAGLPIESLEEPLAQPTLERLAELQSRTAIEIALDESLPHVDWQAVTERRPVHRIVLKPAATGGLRKSFDLARQARIAGLTCVITSALDSAIGVRAAAHLAAAVGAPGVAHGLSTSEWFAEDLAEPLPIADGWMALGGQPGLGIQPMVQ